MKSISKKVVGSVLAVALSFGASVWASSLPDESGLGREEAPSSPLQRKDARIFSFKEIDYGRGLEESEDSGFNPGPFERPPTFPSMNEELTEKLKTNLMSTDSASSSIGDIVEEQEKKNSPKTRKKSTTRTHSIKSSEGEPLKKGRKRGDSKSKKESPKDIDDLLLSSKISSSPEVLPKVIEAVFVEEDREKGPTMKATIASSIASAPISLTAEEVARLLAIPLEYRKVSLGFNSTLNGEVVTQKEEIQGGLASHKLPAPGVARIATILEENPEATALLDNDEKRIIHTLSDEGFKGLIAHYYLVLQLDDGTIYRIPSSEFSIAYAVKP